MRAPSVSRSRPHIAATRPSVAVSPEHPAPERTYAGLDRGTGTVHTPANALAVCEASGILWGDTTHVTQTVQDGEACDAGVDHPA